MDCKDEKPKQYTFEIKIHDSFLLRDETVVIKAADEQEAAREVKQSRASSTILSIRRVD